MLKNSEKKFACTSARSMCAQKFSQRNNFLLGLCKKDKNTSHIYCYIAQLFSLFYGGKVNSNFMTKLMCRAHALHHLYMKILFQIFWTCFTSAMHIQNKRVPLYPVSIYSLSVRELLHIRRFSVRW